MKRVLNFRVVEGDPNEISRNEILLIRDNSTGKIKSIRERESNGSLKELIPDNYIYCRVKDWKTDLTDGQKITLLSLGEWIGLLISSSLVNFLAFSNIYAPFDIISYSNGEGTNRYSKVKAIRIQKAYLPVNMESTEFIRLETLEDLQNIIKLVLGVDIDISKALEVITKDEFDSMEILTLPI